MNSRDLHFAECNEIGTFFLHVNFSATERYQKKKPEAAIQHEKSEGTRNHRVVVESPPSQ